MNIKGFKHQRAVFIFPKNTNLVVPFYLNTYLQLSTFCTSLYNLYPESLARSGARAGPRS